MVLRCSPYDEVVASNTMLVCSGIPSGYRNTRSRDNVHGRATVNIMLPCQWQKSVASDVMFYVRMLAEILLATVKQYRRITYMPNLLLAWHYVNVLAKFLVATRIVTHVRGIAYMAKITLTYVTVSATAVRSEWCYARVFAEFLLATVTC